MQSCVGGVWRRNNRLLAGRNRRDVTSRNDPPGACINGDYLPLLIIHIKTARQRACAPCQYAGMRRRRARVCRLPYVDVKITLPSARQRRISRGASARLRSAGISARRAAALPQRAFRVNVIKSAVAFCGAALAGGAHRVP